MLIKVHQLLGLPFPRPTNLSSFHTPSCS